jgi:hypothetical protein
MYPLVGAITAAPIWAVLQSCYPDGDPRSPESVALSLGNLLGGLCVSSLQQRLVAMVLTSDDDWWVSIATHESDWTPIAHINPQLLGSHVVWLTTPEQQRSARQELGRLLAGPPPVL